jgi:TPR repeat protein
MSGAQHLGDAVGRCDVLLAVIGEQWLQASVPGSDRRRLDDPRDFVRIEIEAALKRGIPVIPVLVGRAAMPAEQELPDDLRGLAFRNAAEVRPGRDFHGHVDRLVRGIEFLLRQGPSVGPGTAPAETAPGQNPEPLALVQEPPRPAEQQPMSAADATGADAAASPPGAREVDEEVEEDVADSGDGWAPFLVGAIAGAAFGVVGGFFLRGVVGALAGGLAGYFLGGLAGWSVRRLKRPARVTARQWVKKGIALTRRRRHGAALDAYRKALRADPDFPAAHVSLARLLAFGGAATRDLPEALSHAERACSLTDNTESVPLRAFAAVAAASGRFAEAATTLRRAVEWDPKSAEAHNSLAWIRATCPDDAVRDGQSALRHATRACDLTKWGSPMSSTRWPRRMRRRANSRTPSAGRRRRQRPPTTGERPPTEIGWNATARVSRFGRPGPSPGQNSVTRHGSRLAQCAPTLRFSGRLRSRGSRGTTVLCLHPGRGTGGPSLALVPCTGAALRRPSVCLSTRRGEGCFSPAVGTRWSSCPAAWSNPADVVPPDSCSTWSRRACEPSTPQVV